MALVKPCIPSALQVQEAMRQVDVGRGRFFRPFRVLDHGTVLTQGATATVAKVKTYQSCQSILEDVEVTISELPESLAADASTDSGPTAPRDSSSSLKRMASSGGCGSLTTGSGTMPLRPRHSSTCGSQSFALR